MEERPDLSVPMSQENRDSYQQGCVVSTEMASNPRLSVQRPGTHSPSWNPLLAVLTFSPAATVLA
jgi:hypothetical protein